MFADRATIIIKSGKGGDGHVSFRREKYVPDGGPDGGDGGRGGDIVFVVDDGLNTLTDYRHRRKFAAQPGEEGGKRNCHGKNGEDLILKVPAGTVIKDAESGKVIADMSGDNRRQVILKGGRGGLGNQHFATSTMQAPKYAQPGGDAIELEVKLELKVMFTSIVRSRTITSLFQTRARICSREKITLGWERSRVRISNSFLVRGTSCPFTRQTLLCRSRQSPSKQMASSSCRACERRSTLRTRAVTSRIEKGLEI